MPATAVASAAKGREQPEEKEIDCKLLHKIRKKVYAETQQRPILGSGTTTKKT